MPVQGSHRRSHSFGRKTARAELMLSSNPMNSIPFSPAQRPPVSRDFAKVSSTGRGHCSSLMLTSDMTSSMNAKFPEVTYDTAGAKRDRTPQGFVPGQDRRGSQRSLTLKPTGMQAGSKSQKATLPNPVAKKSRSSPWFWHRKSASKSSLNQSASKPVNWSNGGSEEEVAAAVTGASQSRNREEESSFGSKTSTLSSVFTEDHSDRASIASASGQSLKKGGRFMRFWRNTFSSSSKRYRSERSKSPPACMTQSGLEILAGKQANIAKLFADPAGRLTGPTPRNSHFSNGHGKISSFESLTSHDTMDSQSTSGFSDDLHEKNLPTSSPRPVPKTLLTMDNEFFGQSRTDQKPPLSNGRSHSSVSKRRYNSGTLKSIQKMPSMPSQPVLNNKVDVNVGSLDRHQRTSITPTDSLVQLRRESGTQLNNRDNYCSFTAKTEACLLSQQLQTDSRQIQNGTPRLRRYERERCPSPCSPAPSRISEVDRRNYVNFDSEPVPASNGTLRRRNQQEEQQQQQTTLDRVTSFRRQLDASGSAYQAVFRTDQYGRAPMQARTDDGHVYDYPPDACPQPRLSRQNSLQAEKWADAATYRQQQEMGLAIRKQYVQVADQLQAAVARMPTSAPPPRRRLLGSEYQATDPRLSQYEEESLEEEEEEEEATAVAARGEGEKESKVAEGKPQIEDRSTPTAGRSPRGPLAHTQLAQRGVADGTDQHQHLPPNRHEEVLKVPKGADSQVLRNTGRANAEVAFINANDRSKLIRRQTFAATTRRNFAESTHVLTTRMPPPSSQVKSSQLTAANPFEGSIHLKRIARPGIENERHRDTSLKVTIHESKNLPPQKRYFCDICLDRKLYARTTSKLFKDTVFWGECFDLNNLPELSFITINLYKEADYSKDSRRRKSSKCQNQLIAYLTLAVTDLSAKYESQQWHTMQLVNSSTSTANSLSSSSLSTAVTAPFSLPHHSLETDSNGSSSSNLFSPSDRAGLGGGQHAIPNKRSVSVAGTAPIVSGLLLMGSKSKRSSKHSVGSCEGGLSSFCGSASPSQPNPNLPQIRLVVQYQSVDVLPLAYYDDLRKFVIEKYLPLVEFLEPLLSTKKKEEIAKCLVNIHEKADNSDVAGFLASIVNHELDSYDNLSLLFRSNSIGSKAVESYVKLVAAEYLQTLFKTFIENLITSSDDLEVDPSRLMCTNSSGSTSPSTSNFSSPDSNSRLAQNQRALMNLVKVVWAKVKASLKYFPHDLRESLSSIRRTVEARHGEEVADQMISGCLFLRYLCPALHGPALFGLINAVPDDPRVSRNLTLIAKVLQTMANFSHFEAKENYMRFMNDFVLAMTDEVRGFLRAVSTTGGATDVDRDIWIKRTTATYNCHGCIDLGYELTMMHKYLSGVVETHPNIPEEIHELPSVLRSINQLSTASNLRRSASGLSSTDTSISVDRYHKESAHPPGSAFTPMFNQRESKLSTISAPQGLGSPCGFECRPIQLEGHFVNPRNVVYSGLPRRNVASHPSLLKLDTASESKSPVKFDNASETAEEEVGVGEVGTGTDSECERLDETPYAYSTRDQQFFGDDFACNGAGASGIISNLSKPYTDAELGSISEAAADSTMPTKGTPTASTPVKVFSPPPRPPPSASILKSPSSPGVSNGTLRGRSNSLKQRASPKLKAPALAATTAEREKPMEQVKSPRRDRLNGSLRRTSSRGSLRGSLAAGRSPTWDGDATADAANVSPALYQKWPSGPDMHTLATDGPELAPVAARPTLTLHFPPPPPVTMASDSPAPPVGELRSTGWNGSCTNIRMGTRAIRMSRERDLSGLGTASSPAPAVSTPERDRQTDLSPISPVPVILQCTEMVNPASVAKVPTICSTNDYKYRPPGVPRSIASTSVSDLAHLPDAVPSLTWAEEGNMAAGSTYITDNLGPMRSIRWPGRSPPATGEIETTAFHVADSASTPQNLCPREAPIEADSFVPASVHRQRRNIVSRDSAASAISAANNGPPHAAGSEDEALLAKVYNFLFGNVGAKEPVWPRDPPARPVESENVYQNYQRDSPHGQFVDSGMESLESSHLETLESRLRIMEEQVQQTRNEIAQATAVNSRLQLQDQEMGINDLVNQIRLLRLMRQRDTVGHSSSSSSSANFGFPNQNDREVLITPVSASTFQPICDAPKHDALTACRTENGETPPTPQWTNSPLFDTHTGAPQPLSDLMEGGGGRGPRKQQQQGRQQRRF